MRSSARRKKDLGTLKNSPRLWGGNTKKNEEFFTRGIGLAWSKAPLCLRGDHRFESDMPRVENSGWDIGKVFYMVLISCAFGLGLRWVMQYVPLVGGEIRQPHRTVNAALERACGFEPHPTSGAY